jgi:acyl dehydratase
VIAFREVIEWKFIKPVFIGDILCAELNVTGAKALPRIGAGSVIITVELKNQKNETCMKGNWNMLIMSKPK